MRLVSLVGGIMMVLWWVALAWANPYNIHYYDCSEKLRSSVYSRADLCLGDKPDSGGTRKLEVLQLKQTRKFPGYSCQLYRSSLLFRCAVWSHFKLARPPTIQVIVPLTREEVQG